MVKLQPSSCLNFFFFCTPLPHPPSTPRQSLLWQQQQQQSMHCIGGLKHCVWFPADKLTSGDLLTANSTEADTELGAWRQPERGGGCWGRFVGRERRKRRGHRLRDWETDRWRERQWERFNVMKQETGRDTLRSRSIWEGGWQTPRI